MLFPFNLWRGEPSVSIIFWGYFFIVRTGYRLGALSIPGFYLRAVDGSEVFRIDLALTLILAGIAVYFIVVLVGLWRSAHRDRRPGFWGWVAMGLVVQGILGSSLSIVLVHWPGMLESASITRREIRAINLALPHEIEPGIKIERVEYRDRVFTYHVSVDDPAEGLTAEMLKTEIMADGQACGELDDLFRRAVSEVRYEFRYPDAVLTIRVEESECAAHAE